MAMESEVTGGVGVGSLCRVSLAQALQFGHRDEQKLAESVT